MSRFERDGLGEYAGTRLSFQPVEPEPVEVLASDDPRHSEDTCRICSWLRRQPGIRPENTISHGLPIPNENANELRKFTVGHIDTKPGRGA